jgi:hypothetical protein
MSQITLHQVVAKIVDIENTIRIGLEMGDIRKVMKKQRQEMVSK